MEDYKKNIEIARLIARELSGNASSEELLKLKNWLGEDPDNEAVYDSLRSRDKWNERKKILADYDKDKEWEKLSDLVEIGPDKNQKIRRIFRPSVLRYAAIALLALVSVAVFYLGRTPQTQQIAENETSAISPGGNRAVLTLADGSTIVLDTAKRGTIATQAGTEIIKQDDEKLTFAKSSGKTSGISSGNGTEADLGAVGMNTIATPRGGKYSVELPDGSLARLNAASSIKFPVRFAKNERRVEVTGEVYFEVEKGKIPFIVTVGNKSEVKVLGTHFNINAYDDESAIRTTLVEGSVQVTGFDNQPVMATTGKVILKPGEKVVLKPGQQSELNPEGRILVKEVNTSLFTGWIDNRFIFKDNQLEEIMKNMSRWYDFEVIYADASVKGLCFTGNIPMETGVEEVFTLLEKTKRIKFQITHKTITIMKEP
jgi:ferric-dicitrate binding protein FerR (iron transport regulator)